MDWKELGLKLGHEAYRDGIAGTRSEQQAETFSAVVGHAGMAARMEEYGQGFTGLLAAEADAYKKGDMAALMLDSLYNYSSDADYWKIKMYADGTHELIDDHKKTLSIDYINAEGEKISTSEIKDDRLNKMGWAESLVTVLGVDRAQEILGSSYLNADNYDYQTLKDVLKFDDMTIAKIQRKGSLEGIELTESQKKSLLGEALIKKSGADWNKDKGVWNNIDKLSLTITDSSFNGNIMAEVQDGKYLYSSVSATLFRDPDSWNSFTSKDGKTWSRNVENYNKDTILYEKTGLNWDYYDSLLVDHYQTVDNFMSKAGTNQPFYDSVSQQWIQGNTINSSFNMGYYTDWQKDAGYENDVLVINNATTVNGTKILNDGRDIPDSKTPRWLGHDTSKRDDNGKWIDTFYLDSRGNENVTGYSDGCLITTRDNQKELLNHLNNNWNFTNGIQIKGSLFNDSYSNYMLHYPNTRRR